MKFIRNVKLYIICPKKDEEIFIKTITSPNYEIINEETANKLY